jgi:hypothetical protein
MFILYPPWLDTTKSTTQSYMNSFLTRGIFQSRYQGYQILFHDLPQVDHCQTTWARRRQCNDKWRMYTWLPTFLLPAPARITLMTGRLH